jgi:hypothetical protein
MTTLNIVQWNAFMVDENTVYPAIFVMVPADQQDRLLEKHVHLVVLGTDTPYDNQVMEGLIKPSEYILGYRPNFQQQTGLFAIVLNTQFESYPFKNGWVVINDEMKNPFSSASSDFVDELNGLVTDQISGDNLEKNVLIGVIVVVALLILGKLIGK